MGFLSKFFKRKLVISTENPYDRVVLFDWDRKMDGYKAQINGCWKDKYAQKLRDKGVKHLFLNTALGWECDNYDFLQSLDFLESLVVLDVRNVSLKPIESLKSLRNLSLTTLSHYDIDFSQFKCLVSLFCSAEKPVPSVFQCTSLKNLYLDEFRMGDNHQLSQLHNLESLTIGNSNMASLDFVRSLPKLRQLVILNNRKITDFSPISSLTQLSWLELRGVTSLHSISFLEHLMELNVLLLECGAIESIRPISHHSKLGALSLWGRKFMIDDGDLTPISTLDHLSMLSILNKKSYNARINNLWNWDNYGKPRQDWIQPL